MSLLAPRRQPGPVRFSLDTKVTMPGSTSRTEAFGAFQIRSRVWLGGRARVEECDDVICRGKLNRLS